MRIVSRWIKDLNISQALHHKSPRGKHKQEISAIPHSNIFTVTSLRARGTKERINKWDFIKIKSFCMAKENISSLPSKY